MVVVSSDSVAVVVVPTVVVGAEGADVMVTVPVPGEELV